MNNTTMTGPGHTPNADLPPLDQSAEKRTMIVEIQVASNFSNRLDNQWMIEREIHAGRYSWRWPETIGDRQNAVSQLVGEYLAWKPEHSEHTEALRAFEEWARVRLCVTLG